MSSKYKAPKGYTDKTFDQLRRECDQILFALGQAAYNERYAQQEQDRLNELLEEMNNKLMYAQKAEAAAKVKEDNEKKRKEHAEKEALPVTTAPSSETSEEQPTP